MFHHKPGTLLANIIFAAVFILPQAAFGQRSSSDANPGQEIAHPTLADVDRAMQTFVDDGSISGAVTLVGHRGEIIHLGTVGNADLISGKKMSSGTMFSIASMTKPIVATALMMLKEEGKLSIEDPVSKYIPSFAQLRLADGRKPAREITIRDAITHTSGLAGKQSFSGSLEQAVAELAERPLAFEPGSRWKYSPGLNVAGRVIEVVSGQPLDTFLQRRIFEPLQMKSTTFFPDDQQSQRVATLYAPGESEGSLVAAENTIAIKDPQGSRGPNPSGGLYSTAEDLFRFYQMVLGHGTFRDRSLLGSHSVEQMIRCHTGDLKTGFTPGNCWGLGWCIVQQPQGVTEMLSAGTFGHGGAFGTQGWVDPQTQTIYVLMIQRTKLPNSDDSEIRRAFQQAAAKAIKT